MNKYICKRDFSIFKEGEYYSIEFLSNNSFYGRAFGIGDSMFVYFHKNEILECFFIPKLERRLKLKKLSSVVLASKMEEKLDQ